MTLKNKIESHKGVLISISNLYYFEKGNLQYTYFLMVFIYKRDEAKRFLNCEEVEPRFVDCFNPASTTSWESETGGQRTWWG